MKKVLLVTGLLALTISCGGKQKQMELESEIAEIKMEQSQKRFEDSLVKATAAQSVVEDAAAVAGVPASKTPAATASTTSTSNTGSTASSSGTTETPKEKKKMSNAVKGALIGAGSGAVVGAVASKKKPGKGAVIGGLVGAGAGAATGAIVDSEKKRKEAEKK